MAKKKVETQESVNGDVKHRTMADYVFEEHREDGTVMLLGLTMHYPSEASTVVEYLESKRDELGIEGKIRICKKIYS